ncbi:integrase, catalytic region, zinc finger, CCHC-type containing protein [Tanacetum coccineum]
MSDAFDELEAELDQSTVDRKHDAIERKNLLLEHDNIIADCLLKECFGLEAELSNLRDDVRKDNYNDLLNRFSNLEVNHLNLQLKYQNLKDSFQNKPSSSVNDTPDFNSVFVIGQMKASLQGKDNVIQKLKMQISQFQETRSELDRPLDLRARDFQISQLTEKITRAKHTEQTTALKRVSSYTDASGSQLGAILKKLGSPQRVTAEERLSQKHMTGDRSRLMNFVKKLHRDKLHVEGLGHNLFSVSQFCDSDLEMPPEAFLLCCDTDGVVLYLKGSRGSNLYTISVEDMLKSSPICLLSKASRNKSWLWHRRLNHLNFGTINDLARKDLVRGLPS